MKIVRQTPNEIVIRDSSVWMAALSAITFLLVAAFTALHHNWKGFALSFLLLAFVFAWLRRSTVTFRLETRALRWERYRYFGFASGQIPFSAVNDIAVEELSARGRTGYRLCIVAPHERVPVSTEYNSTRGQAASLRDTLLRFMGKSPLPEEPSPGAQASDASTLPNPDAARVAELDASVRALLQQGRKVDAILLVQRSEHLNLTEATFRVNQIEIQRKKEREEK